MSSGRSQRARNARSTMPLYSALGSDVLCTSRAPSLNSKAGRFRAAGAAAAGVSTGGGAVATCTLGGGAAGILTVSTGLGTSVLGSGGFSFTGSGLFSLGIIVTVISFSFLPRIPSRAAKQTIATLSAAPNTSETVRLTLAELFFLRWTLELLLHRCISEWFGSQAHLSDVRLLKHVHYTDYSAIFGVA